ncbi:MAG: Uma2 family endonuclease, partial [Acidobacteriota bacterium]|jgi:Uma2 family endonuclease|nr:Uma2 family endonuclease [Acidobacteriota bacterium]
LLPDNPRCELIEGLPRMMTSPSRMHQEISGELFVRFHGFLHGKPCEVYYAPFDVRLNADEHDDIVVQPDLVVVCDKAKLNDSGCVGAPDLVVEIQSPSTVKHDRLKKFNLYLRHGVKEYWIVDPDARYVEVFILENGGYRRFGYDETETVAVGILPGLEINLAGVFGALLP